METGLKKDRYETMALVWSGTAGREAAEEYVVPDMLPDVGSILDADSVLTMRGKETENGYVQLSADVSVSVLYLPEAGGPPQNLELSLSPELRLDAPEADTDCGTVAGMRVRGLDVRVLNSRKLSVRADIEAWARCYRRTELEVASALAEEGAAAHILQQSADVLLVTDVREKTFVLTDEYMLPAVSGGGDELVSRRVEPVLEDVKYVSGKAVFRGRVRTELVFLTPERDRLYTSRFETEFSQIMEVDGGEGEAAPEVTLLLTSAYFDRPEYGRDAGRVEAELHLAAQCECRSLRTISYIGDIYSNRTELLPERETLSVVREARPITLRQTVTGKAEPPVASGELLRASASVGAVSWEDGTVKTTVNVRLVFAAADGGFAAARCRLPAEFTRPEGEGRSELKDVTVSVTDVYCAAGSDVRVALQMDALALTSDTLSCVSGVTEDVEAWNAREKTASVTLIRVPAGTDLWTVARRYHSTVEGIEAVNDGRREGLLLIPKGR